MSNIIIVLNEMSSPKQTDEDEFEKYNEILSSVGGCIFAYSGGFGWCLPKGRSCRGFDTAESAYIDACREVERGTE